MTRFRLTLAGLFMATAGTAQAAEPVRILANWFAQPDQGGYWQAQIDDLGAAAGLKITVLQGGPRIQTIPQVASGQAEFGIGNADDVMLARLHGAPVRAVFVSLDHAPYDLVYHPESGIKTIADLKGKTVAVALGVAYWDWVKKHYGLAGMREVPVSGDISLFRNDPNMVQQGYSILFPYRLDEAGIANAQFKIADLGYRPYDVLFTTDEMIEKHPEQVRAVMAAVKQGWQRFLADPSKVRALVLDLNKQMPPGVNDKAVVEMKAELVPQDPARLGCMSDARWQELGQQLRDINFLPAGFDIKGAYDAGLVPGC